MPNHRRPQLARTGSKTFALGVVSQIASQAIVSGLGVVLLKIMTNNLGPYDYGIYATGLAFVSTFALFTDLGLNAITPREIAKNPDDASAIIGHNMGLRLVLCAVSIPALYVLAEVFYPGTKHRSLRETILILSCYLIFDSVRQITAAYLTAHRRIPIAAGIATVQQVLLVALSIAVSVVSLHLVGYAWAYVLVNGCAALISMVVVSRAVRVRPRFNLGRWVAIFRTSIAVGLFQVINMLYLKADSVMLSLLKTTTAVGVYAIAYLLLSAFAALPSYVMSSLIPTLVNASHEEVAAIMRRVCHYVSLLAGLLLVLGISLRHDLVAIVSSGSYSKAATPFAILLGATSFSYLITVFSYASVLMSKHRRLVFSSIVCLSLNIGLNAALIPRYSVNGAATATAICEVVSLTLVYRVFSSGTGLSIPFVAQMFKTLAATAAASVAAGFVDAKTDIANRFAHVLVIGAIGVLGYVLFAVLLRAVPSELMARLRPRGPMTGATTPTGG